MRYNNNSNTLKIKRSLFNMSIVVVLLLIVSLSKKKKKKKKKKSFINFKEKKIVAQTK